ncbi:unnamed protein product, partial [Pleuronectes platessa]
RETGSETYQAWKVPKIEPTYQQQLSGKFHRVSTNLQPRLHRYQHTACITCTATVKGGRGDNCTSSAMGINSSINAFSLDLFRTLSRANPSGNMLVSPLSIRSALAMVYLGARGETAAQMEKALSYFFGVVIHAEFKKLFEDINSTSGSYVLKTANRLYGDNTEKFLTQYREAMPKYYQADLKTVDFIGALEASRKEINTWVEQQHRQLVLVNAIYLKADWKNLFNKAQTKGMPFKVSQNESKPVQMMIQMKKLPYNYIPEYGLQILELPFMEEELSMFILLPKQSSDGYDPLLKLEKELTLERLNEWTDRGNMDVQSEILVHLPKFKLEEDYEMKGFLSELGMKDVFRASEADLSGMNGGRDLFLSTVAHKAIMSVSEQGIEAAGATGPPGNRSSMLRGEPFTADHPFLFYIRHNKTQTIFFLGRFVSPQ